MDAATRARLEHLCSELGWLSEQEWLGQNDRAAVGDLRYVIDVELDLVD